MSTKNCPLTAELISLNHFADISCRLSTLDLHANELGVPVAAAVAQMDTHPLTQLMRAHTCSLCFNQAFFSVQASLLVCFFCLTSNKSEYTSFSLVIVWPSNHIYIYIFICDAFMGLCTLSSCSRQNNKIIDLRYRSYIGFPFHFMSNELNKSFGFNVFLVRFPNVQD